ncbi:MAG: nickel-binding protein [Synechococcus sp.]
MHSQPFILKTRTRNNLSLYAALMRLHGANGDRANALQVYHQCMTLLREELGVEPSAATRMLYEQLLLEDEAHEGSLSGDIGKDSASKDLQGKNLQGTVGAAMTQVVVLSLPPLVGRETEWETLQHSLLSSDRLRMICTFDAPDAEVIREAHRKVGVPFERVWAGKAIEP